MANGITWVHSDKGGFYPCSNSQELAEYKKVGFVECGDKPSRQKIETDPIVVASEPVNEESKELSKDDLIELAADSGIAIDKRWNIQRIKEAVGL